MKFKVGDMVYLNIVESSFHTRIVKIIDLDNLDTRFPYKIQIMSEKKVTDWVGEEDLSWKRPVIRTEVTWDE